MHPINKKYFGNRNIGSSSTTSDDKIGGEGIASIDWASLGTFRTTPVGLALPAPTLPGGVQAAWSTLTYEVNGVVTSAGKTDLAVGWKGTSTLFPNMVAVVTSVSGSNAVFSILTDDGGAKGDSFTALPNGGNTNTITLTHQGATGGAGLAATFVVDVNVHLIAPTITESGSGYTGEETFNVTVAGGMDPPAGTIVLTTDSGAAGSATNQENAIIVYANVGGEGGTLVGDVIKQVNGFAYKVKTADGTKQKCLLVANSSPNEGEMYIKATDNNGNTYFVTKLTSRVATLVQDSNNESEWLFANGGRAKWTLSSDINDDQVTIENA